MDKLLSDQRLMVFLGSVLLALAGWGGGFKTWPEMFTTQAVFGLMAILGALLSANAAHNIFAAKPTITSTTEPASTVTTTVTTPPQGDK
jgi:hypothetical protein